MIQPSHRTAGRRMPAVFVGHGSPMNAIEDNRWSRGFAGLAAAIPRPQAIVAVSAHWYGPDTRVTGSARPETIHDFSGFPPELYEIRYPAPGAPGVAARVLELLRDHGAATSDDWGLDHGTWSVLRWMFPAADVPVIQLSIDARLSMRQHFELAFCLRPLRDEGVLIMGSGNVVHNLHDAFQRRRAGAIEPPDWAARFDATVAGALVDHDTETLLMLWPDTEDGRRAHPGPDHWIPLIYVHAAADASDPVAFPITGFDWGSLSMRAVVLG